MIFSSFHLPSPSSSTSPLLTSGKTVSGGREGRREERKEGGKERGKKGGREGKKEGGGKFGNGGKEGIILYPHVTHAAGMVRGVVPSWLGHSLLRPNLDNELIHF